MSLTRSFALTSVIVLVLASGCTTREVIVEREPPPARVEVIPVAPSPRHVWTAGHWEWRHGNHVWVDGVYVVPPHPHETYVPGHYTASHHGYVYHPGHWRP